jgi:hypothetical protein
MSFIREVLSITSATKKHFVAEGLAVGGGWSACMQKKTKSMTSSTCNIEKKIYKSQTKHQNYIPHHLISDNKNSKQDPT